MEYSKKLRNYPNYKVHIYKKENYTPPNLNDRDTLIKNEQIEVLDVLTFEVEITNFYKSNKTITLTNVKFNIFFMKFYRPSEEVVCNRVVEFH